MPGNPHEVPHIIAVVACDCHSHGISIEAGDFGEEAYLCTWYQWHSVRVLSIRDLVDRFKFAWQILTEGKSCADCIILTRTSLDELMAELQNVRNEVWPENAAAAEQEEKGV